MSYSLQVREVNAARVTTQALPGGHSIKCYLYSESAMVIRMGQILGQTPKALNPCYTLCAQCPLEMVSFEEILALTPSPRSR